MKKIYTIKKIKEIVAPIAAKYGVENVFLFGSYARGDADDKSDVDLRIDRGKVSGLDFVAFADEVEENLKIKTDVLTTPMLSEKFLKTIEDDEVIIYESK